MAPLQVPVEGKFAWNAGFCLSAAHTVCLSGAPGSMFGVAALFWLIKDQSTFGSGHFFWVKLW